MELIDKEQTKKMLLDLDSHVKAHGVYLGTYFDGVKAGYQSVAAWLDTLPVVEERQHGYWKEVGSWHECSCCKQRIDSWDRKWMKYCSVCGAKMDGDSK